MNKYIFICGRKRVYVSRFTSYMPQLHFLLCSFRVHCKVFVSIPEAFRGPAPSYPIWPFKSSFPTKITPVLWSVTYGCVVWSAEAQGLPALSVVEQNCPSAVIPSTAQGLRLFFRLVNLNCFYQMNFYWGCFFLTLLNFIFTSARVNVWFLSSALLTLVSFALVWQHFVQLTLF